MKVIYANDFVNLKGMPKHTLEELAGMEAGVIEDKEHERFPPIIIWKDEKDWVVVDGNNQHRLRTKHGCKIKYVKLDVESRQEALAYAYKVQFDRRNISLDSRAMAAVEYSKLLPIGSTSGGTTKTENIRQAAEVAGSSERSAFRAEKVIEHGAKAVVQAVTAGDVSVSDAAAVADLPKSEQTEALKLVRDGKAKTLKAAAEMKDEPTPPEQSKDKVGQAIPERILAAFECGDEMRSSARQMSSAVQSILKVAESADGITQRLGTERMPLSAIKVAKKDLAAAINAGLPHAVCPYCKGRGCQQCDKLGWIHKDRWAGIPEERRGA